VVSTDVCSPRAVCYAARRNREDERFLAHDGAKLPLVRRPATFVAVTADLGQLPGEASNVGFTGGSGRATYSRTDFQRPPPSCAGHRGVIDTPCTVSSNPRSLRATVVILERQTSASVAGAAQPREPATTRVRTRRSPVRPPPSRCRRRRDNRRVESQSLPRSLPCSTTVRSHRSERRERSSARRAMTGGMCIGRSHNRRRTSAPSSRSTRIARGSASTGGSSLRRDPRSI